MNINLAVEVNVWHSMRLIRTQSPPLTWFLRLLGVGLFVWGVLTSPSSTLILLGWCAFIFTEGAGLGRYWASRRLGRTHQYVLSDQGINIRTQVTNFDIVWDAITHVRETASDWLLRGVKGTIVIQLPKDAFTPPDDQTFRDFLTERHLITSRHA